MNTLGNILLTVGFFGILGSAGASDLNDISLQQAFIQVICSIFVIVLGLMIKNKVGERNEQQQK